MPSEVERLRARVAALEELLEVHERTSLDQANRLERALEEQTRARKHVEAQASQLEAQSEEMASQAEELESQAVELEATQAELEEANEGLRLANQELGARHDEAERLLESRARFYASMSHELRTPINAILGYNDLLLSGIYGELSDVQLQGLERSQKATRHLRELVDDVLDLSKMEAGKIDLVREEVSLPDLIDDLMATVHPYAEEHGSELRLHADGDVPTIRTDGRRVRQIVLNLLSNAVKFGGSKPVEVRCSPWPEGGVVTDVVDRGEGIAEEDLSRIFDEFVQIGGVEESGTGLGLAISRRMAEVLGGSLEAESEVGEGSTFRLVLPAEMPSGLAGTAAGTEDAS